MIRFFSFLKKVFSGKDFLLVQQTKEQWERQFDSGTWDRLQEGQPNTSELARLILNYARTRNKSVRVLDVGCGNGGLARLLCRDPSIAYTGIDISETAIRSARSLVPYGNFIVADVENPPSGIDIFDVFVFNEVLYYMNPDRVLPRYRIHATADAYMLVSVVRFWRTPFVFHRIRHYLRIDRRFRVADNSRQWYIAVGHFL